MHLLNGNVRFPLEKQIICILIGVHSLRLNLENDQQIKLCRVGGQCGYNLVLGMDLEEAKVSDFLNFSCRANVSTVRIDKTRYSCILHAYTLTKFKFRKQSTKYRLEGHFKSIHCPKLEI